MLCVKKKNCTSGSQSESSNFVVYIISSEIKITKYNFRLKLHSSHFNDHFIMSIFTFNGNVKQSFGNKSCRIHLSTAFFGFHFPAISFVTWNKPWIVTGCFVLVFLSHWLRKRYDLEQKIVRFGNKLDSWEPIRLQGSPVISKKM